MGIHILGVVKICLEKTVDNQAVDVTNFTDCWNNIGWLLLKMATGLDSFMVRVNILVKKMSGYLNCITYIGTVRQYPTLIFTYVIVYETPTFGGHHFSLGLWSSSEQVKTPLKKPKWVKDLHQKQPLLDLDTVILAINCATAARLLLQRHVHPEKSMSQFHIVCFFFTFIWKLLAVSVASFSTLSYITLQFLHVLLSWGSQSSVYTTLAKVFSNTGSIMQIRCSQILYWPISLQDNGFRSQSCVEYAEKAASQKHSMWLSIAVDVILGNLLGIAMLFHAESTCLWVLNFAKDITNYLLRSGCVWLMGIPAGFKLNTELAGVLGMISLNAIQFWSTLWFFVDFLFIYFIKGLAISGVLFGMTTPAALLIDIISLATVHVSTLHCSISLLYSWQLHAIAALWRLFRGQKWNPLRQRLDSYEHTVEQHIVGSLLFTPLLLLLPTTSAFYIFFTIMNTTVIFVCILVEVTISFVHTTPYTKLFLWLVKPRRFPSGIWFEILSGQSNVIDASETRFDDEIGCVSEKSSEGVDIGQSKSTILVSLLHGNYLNMGQIVWPHCRYVYSAVSRSSIASSVYGVLTGKSIPSAMGTRLPSKMPWMCIPCKEYWRLCHDAVLACKTDCTCHARQ
ncbi:unnamed protein product [Ilex paraguariensis]|uniref:N-acetylglucosaminyl transferase component n=1 Tax=Ilex paraguariensis TaxID=185542 RepID=A0ABC8USK0_9AQUA